MTQDAPPDPLQEIDRLADAISAVSVTGDFERFVRCESDDPRVQKLFMMVNLLLDTAHTALRQLRERNAELERTQATVAEQREQIASLSAPVIEVWEGVLMLPLLGPVTASDVAHWTAALLDAVGRRRARAVIFDLTGVDRLEREGGEALARSVRAVELLGARSIVVGLSPALARTIAAGDIDLSATPTLRDLRQALRLCLADRR